MGKGVLVLAMRSGSAPKMPFLNVFVIFCVCIHTLPIQIVTFTQFEIRTLKNDIFFLTFGTGSGEVLPAILAWWSLLGLNP